ncbi:hypothetical protein V3C99_016426 [Haemonchus contortus]
MLAAALLLLLPLSQATFFGGGGCSCPCVPAPACAPPPQPVCPPPPVCGSSFPVGPSYQPPPPSFSPPQYFPQPGGAGYAQAPQGYPVASKKRLAHGVKTGEKSRDEQLLAETAGLRRRVRRDTEAAFDPKCNSELLKEIILANMDATTAVAKRQIQEAATTRLGGRIDVVCSTGTFSYIVNTELYCETEKNGTTCFAFRQSS